MADLLAAFQYAQLEKSEEIQERRKNIWIRYMNDLGDWARKHGVALPTIPDSCERTTTYYLLMPVASMREQLMKKLHSEGILAVFHYLPLHLSKMGREFGGEVGQCPVTESASDRLLRLPLYAAMTEDEQVTVINTILQF